VSYSRRHTKRIQKATPIRIADMTITVISAPTMTAGMLIAVDLDNFFSSAGLPLFDVSNESLVHEEDTTPLPIVGGVAQPPLIGSIAAPARSTWQTSVTGIRQLWDINWSTRRSGAVAWMTSVGW
jgi:hypothetical protein